MKTLKRIAVLLVIVGFVAATVPLVWAGENQGKININAATVDELTKLKKVGPKVAQRIVDYREKESPFSKPEDIMKVKGIGQSIYDLNKDMITTE